MRALFLASLALSLKVAGTFGKSTIRSNAPQIQTTSGVVQGHTAAWPQGSTVQEYLGVPYAQPPLGPLRFAAPKAYQSNNTTVFAADDYVSGVQRSF